MNSKVTDSYSKSFLCRISHFETCAHEKSSPRHLRYFIDTTRSSIPGKKQIICSIVASYLSFSLSLSVKENSILDTVKIGIHDFGLILKQMPKHCLLFETPIYILSSFQRTGEHQNQSNLYRP